MKCPTLKSLAAELGYTREAIQVAKRKFSDFPKVKKGEGYDVAEWRAWLDKHGQCQHTGKKNMGNDEVDLSENSEGLNLTDVKIKKELTIIQEKQLKMKILTGRLVGIKDATRAFNIAVNDIVQKKDLFIKRAAPRLVGLKNLEDVEDVLKGEVETWFALMAGFKFKPDKTKQLDLDNEDEEEEEEDEET